ncbi:MAG: Uma2 family endonuclease, partial [Chthoniobacterales bacterium]
FSNSRSSAFTKAGASGAPDLVVEILSPGAEKHDRVLKRDVFARSGVKEFWLVQPNERRIVMHRLQANTDQSFETVESDGSFASSLLPGLTIHAADVFAE